MTGGEESTTFTYEVDRNDDTATVAAAGEIDLATSADLRAALQGLLDEGTRSLVLDLDDVTFIDSSGLGVLVGVLKRCNETGASLEIRGANGPVRKVFEITGLHEVFRLSD